MNDAQKNAVLKSLEDKLSVLREEDILWVSEKIGFNAQNEDGDTLLHLAAFKGLEGVCKFLISAGSDAGLLNKKGQVAADIALECGNLELALVLRSGESAGLSRHTIHQSTSVGLQKDENRGEFVPTASTRLLDDAPSWDIPDELNAQREDRSVFRPSDKSDILSTEIDKISLFLKREEIKPEKCIVAIHARLSDIFQMLRLTNPIESSHFEYNSALSADEDELLGLVNDFLDPGDVTDYVVSRAYTLEQELGALRNQQAENLLKVLKVVESVGGKYPSEPLLGEALNLLNTETVVEGLHELIWKIKEFANYLDARNSEDDRSQQQDIAKYLRSSVKFQRFASSVCDLAPDNKLPSPSPSPSPSLTSDLDPTEVDPSFQAWLQPSQKVQLPEDLIDLAFEIYSEVHGSTESRNVFKSLGLDERLWSFDCS